MRLVNSLHRTLAIAESAPVTELLDLEGTQTLTRAADGVADAERTKKTTMPPSCAEQQQGMEELTSALCQRSLGRWWTETLPQG